MAEESDCSQGDVAGALDGPFVVLFEQDCPNETCVIAASFGKMQTTSVLDLLGWQL